MGATEQRNASQELVAVVRSDQFVEQIALALPETVSPRRFARIAVTAIQQNPDLASCTRDSVFQALLRCAADGLLPDGRQAALTKFKNKTKGVDEATYMPMIDGLRHIAAEYGWALRTAVVYANDEFAYSDEPPALTHRSVKPGEARGDLAAAYAVATHKDGRRIQMVLHPADIAKRRAVSKRKEIWEQWPERMWEKSAGRAIFRQLPLSERDMERVQRVLAADDAYERAAADPVAALYGGSADRSDRAAGDGVNGGGGGVAARTGSASAPVGEFEAEAEDGVWDPVDDGPTAERVAEAGKLQVGAGVHMGKTIAQVAEVEDGPVWLLAQLKKDGCPEQVATFVRGALPETWEQYEAWVAERSS